MNKKKLPLAFWIFIGLVVGIAVGLALMMVPNGLDIAKNYILPWGTIFLNLLKFIVVPIVLFSIASGVISMQDIGRVGSVGGKTIVYYMCTTAFAVVLALVLASAAKGMHIFAAMETSGLAYEPPAGQSLMQTIIDIFPSNPITPLANASMLQVIVISLLVGFGILLAGEKGLVAAQVVDSFNEVSMKIMDLIIKLSPIGVACLICPVIVENGPKILAQLVAVLAVAYVGYIVHAVVVYSSTVKALGGVSPIAFFKGMAPGLLLRILSGHPALHPGVLRAAGGPEGGRLLRAAPGRHHQHGRNCHLPGGVRRFHRILLWDRPDHRPDGHHRAHRHLGFYRHCGRPRRRHGDAGHGAPERKYPGGGHRAGGRHRPDL